MKFNPEAGSGITEKTGFSEKESFSDIDRSVEKERNDRGVFLEQNSTEVSLDDLDKNVLDDRTKETDLGGLIENTKEVSLEDLDRNVLDDRIEVQESIGLSAEEKCRIKEHTGWSDKIVDYFKSVDEANIYIESGLVEKTVNEKSVLCQPEGAIDWDKDSGRYPGWTNKDLIKDNGTPPTGKDGRCIELHHIGQKNDSPLAELTFEQHRMNGNDSILHDKTKESEIDRRAFVKERADYWMAIGKTLED